MTARDVSISTVWAVIDRPYSAFVVSNGFFSSLLGLRAGSRSERLPGPILRSTDASIRERLGVHWVPADRAKSGVEILNLGSTGGMVLPRLVEEGNLLWRESR